MKKEFDAEYNRSGKSHYDDEIINAGVNLITVLINGIESTCKYVDLMDAVQSEIDAAGNGRFSFSFGVEFNGV
jgi:hypothetical protein